MAKRLGVLAVLVAIVGMTPMVRAASFYTEKPNDPLLLVLTPEQFPGLHADGVGDDSDILQQAINQASNKGSVLLVPQGRYRLTKTVGIPPATRVIGFGTNRPVFVLAPNTAGYSGDTVRYMIWFSGGNGGRRRNAPATTSAPATQPTFSDAGAGTFYSGLINIDFDIGEGNPMAAAIRGRFAQHGIIAHVDFNIGSGYAGLDEVGNEAEDLHFHGGSYGVVCSGTSPSWQYTLLDSTFDGQKIAGFKAHNTGLTLIRDTFRNMPTAIAIDENRDERLWMSDCILENISDHAFVIGNENNERTQINVENVMCSKVPQVALFLQSKTQLAAGHGDNYRIHQFSYGFQVPNLRDMPAMRQTYLAEDLADAPKPVASDILPLPPMSTWASLKSFGAKGDGTTDDLEAFKKAIASGNPIFLPRGRYRVSDTIKLEPNTMLIGLNPITTQIAIDDGAPAFVGNVPVKGVIETPVGGNNVIQSIGIDSGANNTAAAGLKWQGAEKSMVNDVKFLGGHGTSIPDGPRLGGPYNADHSGDSNPNRKWSAEPPSLWITQGGGTFANIWTASTFSSAGMLVENTTIPGHVYELSSEHHVYNEIIFSKASNWSIYAEQTEEEWGESEQCLGLKIDHCSDLLFTNLILFRVFAINTPFPQGAEITESHDIRFRGVRVYGQSPYNFDNAILDTTLHLSIPSREISLVNISGDPPVPAASLPPSPVVAAGASPLKVGDGFFNADHAITDSDGTVYFVDMHENKVYKYLPDSNQLSVLRSDPIQPFALALDHANNLIIMSHLGKAYALSLKDPNGKLTELTTVETAPRPNMTAWIPTDRWWDHDYFFATTSRREPLQFISPDNTTYIPVPRDYSTGKQHNWTSQPIDLYRKNQLAPVQPGQQFYVGDENSHQTWRLTANDDGTLKDPQLFAQHGEAGVTTDSAGNVYTCEGYLFIYDASGKPIDTITLPERPLSVVFCGKNRDTLFIAARRAAYTIKMAVKG